MTTNKLTQDKFLTDVEVDSLLKLCNKHKGTRDSIMLRFTLFTGARQCEVLDVTVDDLGEQCVTIRGAKGSNDRTAPLPLEFFEELKMFCSSLEAGSRIFNISTRTFRHIWSMWRLSKKGAHCLRHTFGVRLYNNCEDIHLVKTALGHCSIQNTMKYLEFVESQKKLATATQGMWDKPLSHAA